MDEVFELLSDRERRRLLVALLDDDPLPVGPSRMPTSVRGGDREERDVFVRMVHNHLPKLEDASVVRWDRDADEVHAGPRFEEIRPMLELLADNAADLPGEWV